MQQWGKEVCMHLQQRARSTQSAEKTESILLVGENLPNHLWFNTFVVQQLGEPSQVYVLVYQDNQSTILLQNNGRLSSDNGPKHIHKQYDKYIPYE